MLWASLGFLLCGTAFAGEGVTVLEAEKLVAGKGEVFRHKTASGGQVAIVRWGRMLEASPMLPPGLYEVTAWVSAHPVELLHRLAVTFQAGGEQRTAQAAWFDRSGVYIPIILRVAHGGGPLPLALDATGASGFDGMRRQKSEEEAEYLKKLEKDFLGKGSIEKPGGERDDGLGELEEGKDLRALGPQEPYVACDRIEIRKLADLAAIVSAVRVDKVHYPPGDEVRAEVDVSQIAELINSAIWRECRITALEVRERSICRTVFEKDVQLAEEPTTLSFAYKPGDAEFGRELLVVVSPGGKALEVAPAGLADPVKNFPGSRSEVFGVSRNVYRIGITGGAGGHHRAGMTAADFARVMQANKRAYANYFEVFAWAPCDYSEMTPDAEFFLSGQTQYHGSVSAFKALLAEAHKVGVKGITYGKACAGGIAGWETFRKHPDFFGIAAWAGVSSDRIGVFNCERMLRNEHSLAGPEKGEWQDWQSAWVNAASDAAVDLGADEIIASARMFGWDGVRWDGHFVGNMVRFKKRVDAALPNFIHGYNIAFANPGSKLFLPDKNVEDFHECARGHGLMMDESVRDWSHTNFSPGHTRPFYEAICREADYMKRIGGLPLFITFDMASELDRAYNVLCGLAAGQRYTYLTTPGVWPYGDMARWLTRFSAFVWDDTKRLKEPGKWLSVGDGKADLWWSESCWLRDVAPGRKQLLVNIVAPPRYPAFCNRVQLPSAKLRDVPVTLTLPEGVKLAAAAHLSPDLVAGQEALEFVNLPQVPKPAGGSLCSVVIPRLATWSIVAFDLECAATEPFPLTTPVEDAAAAMAVQREAEEKAKKEAKPPATPPKPGRNWDGYASTHNYDADEEKTPEVAKRLGRPKEIRLARNGELDVHHCRGLFSWLNDLPSAVGAIGGGNQSVSYLERRGWNLSARALDEFPDTYAQLLQNDVLVLDNIHAEELGILRRVMIKDFVEAGGGLLVFGGHFNLSAGRDHTTWLEALMPLTTRRYADFAKDPKGFRLAPADRAFFPDRIDWAKAPVAFCVDTSPLKPAHLPQVPIPAGGPAKVLATAGDHPAIVAGTFGKGRVIVVMINSHGEATPGTTPYWAWPHWPRVVGACIAWLADGCKERSAEAALAQRDPNAPTPDALFVGASEMKDEELTAKLRLAARNVVDKDSAKLLVQCAIAHSKRLTDPEVLTPVIEAAEPFIDASWLDLAEKMLDALEPRLIGAGLRVLGASKDATKRDILEKAIEHRDEEVQREALVALGSLGDAQAAPALERFLAKDGGLRFVAATALMRLRVPGSTRRALEQYAHHLKRIRDLKGGRASILDDLYGGTSFKLTPLARRRLEKRLHQLIRTQKLALQDAAFFEKLLRTMDDAQTQEFVAFLAACDNPDITPLAYAVLARQPADRLKLLAPKLAAARLPGIRLLAE